MYSLETGRDSIPSDSGTELKSLGSRHAKLEEEEGTAQKAFTYIFGGRRKRLNGIICRRRAHYNVCGLA